MVNVTTRYIVIFVAIVSDGHRQISLPVGDVHHLVFKCSYSFHMNLNSDIDTSHNGKHLCYLY